MTAPKAGRDRKLRWFELFGAIALLIVLAVMLFDWNMLRGPIERRVSAATGRDFQIVGDLSVDLSMKPRISFGKMVLGNLPGAKEPRMASVEALDFRLHLLDLLRGDVVLSQMKVSRPVLLLEKNARGQANWKFPQGDADWPTIRQLAVDQGTVTFRNMPRRTDIEFDVRSGKPAADARLAPLLIDGKGSYRGNDVSIEGTVASPLSLKDPGKPYHIDLRGNAGPTSATAAGNLATPLQMTGFDLDFSIRGPSMELLYPLLGLALPETPPYRLRGRLGREARTWHFRDFSGVVGDSDLAGDASVDTAGDKPFLKADLVSRRLDFDDLAGFVGAPPQTGGSETASAAQKRKAAELRARSRLLPDDPFKLDKLRNMNADVKLRAQRINAPALPLEAMTAHLFLDDGVLRLDPLDFEVAGGSISSQIRLDARKDVISTSARIRARRLDLPRLFPDANLTRNSTGRIGASVDLAGQGNSIARMLASSDGELGVIMGRGRISNLLLEYAGIDIAESLKFLLGKDRTVPIRCAFGDFTVANGVMTTRRLAFDTTDTVIFGEGTVSLRDERLDLRLKPQPKDRSLFTLRSPLLVTGTFKDPSFRPDIKRVTLRGLAAAVLASLAPPAALLAVYETGPGEDIACRPISRSAAREERKTD